MTPAHFLTTLLAVYAVLVGPACEYVYDNSPRPVALESIAPTHCCDPIRSR